MSNPGFPYTTSQVTPGLFLTEASGWTIGGAGNGSVALIDATGEKVAITGYVWFPDRTGSKSIRKIQFRFGTITKAGGSALTVSLQDPLTSGAGSVTLRPDEVQDETVAIANADAGFVSNGWYTTGNLSADRSVAFGEMLSIVFEYDGAGRLGSDAVRIAGVDTVTSNSSIVGIPQVALKTSGSWNRVSQCPNIILEFSDGSFGTIHGSFPFKALTQYIFNTGTSGADEYALKFSVPDDIEIDGAVVVGVIIAGHAGEVRLYDSVGSVLASVTMFHGESGWRYGHACFSSRVALTGGDTYYLSWRSADTTSVFLATWTMNASSQLVTHVGESSWCLSKRVDAGAWTDTAAERPFIFPAFLFDGGDAQPGGLGDCDEEDEAGWSMFRNGVATNVTGSIGVTWIEFTSRSGDLYVWSDKPLPDPETYYHGWKEPRVRKFGRIRRAISLRGDGPETSDFTWLLDNSDGLLTQLDADKELVNGTFVARSITDEGRRLEETPRTIYRGVVRDAKPVGTLLYEMRGQDVFAAIFSGTTDQQLVPSRTVPIEDFANCAVDVVSSSAEGYLTNEALGPGGSNILIDTGVGRFSPGDKITFAGHATVYSVTGSSDTEPETLLSVSPDFTAAIANNEAITQIAAHHVEPGVGKAVPFWYGYISDRVIVDGVDVGDGQGPMLYAGDKVLADGFTYGEFIWAGHACYTVGGGPFDMLYFWNESVDQYGALATEAGTGGRIAIPGFDNWDDLGFTEPYVDYGGSPGRRYSVLYLRGIWRDWALGIRSAPPNRGGVPFAVSAYGAETIGDSTGLLIIRGFEEYLHTCLNWIPPVGESYQGGLWATESPAFPDEPTLPVVDENSFALADDQSEVYVSVSPGGFRGDFGIGANDERITRRELIARLNNSFGCDCFTNHRCQFAVTLINTDLGSTTLQPELTWVRDIFTGTWQIEPLTRELHPSLAFRHTRDYFGRAIGGWRSILTGVTELTNDDAVDAYGPGPASAPLLMHMIRGKNRATDPDEHQQGTDTAAVVTAIALARISSIQHLPKFQTGPAGFNYELADVVPVTAYQAAYVERPLRVERIEIDPSNFTTNVELYDLDPILEGSP